ncbi:MAG TPA: hypothetical protein VLS91_04890 [Acidimicrobiales bacterium]|nr:hypothetical protein [Acidimicrobiales bacterium]
MCHRTTCRTCKKPTWSGCGNHIEQALAGVPKNERCQCGADASSGGGLFSKLLGR